jgi:hypothetical protein
MSTIDVRCTPDAGGWTCRVTVGEAPGTTEHSVTVAEADLRRLDPIAEDPTDLVRRSFEFLLEREPRESILRTFDLSAIGRYFPEYERDIRRA